MATNEEWLNSLSVGDVVAVKSNRSATIFNSVERLTRTLIILKGGRRYNKSDGYITPYSAWSTECIAQITPDMIKSKKRRVLRHKISRALNNLGDIASKLKTLQDDENLEKMHTDIQEVTLCFNKVIEDKNKLIKVLT